MKFLPHLVLGCYAMALAAAAATLHATWESRQERVAAPYTLSLTVITPLHESATGMLAPFGPGFERDLLAEFCKPYDNCDIRRLQAPDRETALRMLRAGKADAAVGFAGGSAVPPGITAGPVYYHSAPVEAPLPDEAAKAVPAKDCETAIRAPEASDGAAAQWLDARSWAVWEPFFPLAPEDADEASRSSGNAESHQWFWRTWNPTLHEALTKFWTDAVRPENTLLAELEERYFGYLPESFDPYAVRDLMYLLKRRLPRYSADIAQASGRADLNPLLFTAVIIQESRLDESTVSFTGVRGIMQLTQDTADFLKVDRMDPQAAIGAGARYLRMLWRSLEPLGLEEWDRWFFALAAFNQGPRRLEGAIELARKLGGTGRTWSELKGVFPLLSQKKYAEMVGQNTCRGREAVNFVERVRFSYHVMRGLVALGRPEAKNLAPLLGNLSRSALDL